MNFNHVKTSCDSPRAVRRSISLVDVPRPLQTDSNKNHAFHDQPPQSQEIAIPIVEQFVILWETFTHSTADDIPKIFNRIKKIFEAIE